MAEFPAGSENNKDLSKKPDSVEDGISFSSLFSQITEFNEPVGQHKNKPVSNADKKLDQKAEKDFLKRGTTNVDAIYRKALSLAERIFVDELNVSLKDIEQVKELVVSMLELIEAGEQGLVECVFDAHYRNTIDYEILNEVNVTILSLELGIGLGYMPHSLYKLGVAAFFHDIGMRIYRDLLQAPRELDTEEKSKLNRHPAEGATLLRALNDDFTSVVADIIEQEHERIDGSGYPRGLHETEISEYAQIIGLVDVYEALTHQRPHRKSFTPLGALKVIIEKEKIFSKRLIKVFMERVGLYPRGTFVELNTKEIGIVIGQSNRMPSCPVVRVVYNNHGEKTDQKRTIDLSKGTRIYIVRSI